MKLNAARMQPSQPLKGEFTMAKKDTVVEETVEKTELDATQEAAKPVIEIIRGRMPVAVVAMIRFKCAGMGTSAIAAKYRTTIGKVDDILKGRNFGYVVESFVPSEQQIADAKVYLEQLTGENATETLAILEAMGQAEDGGAAFEEARKASRKSSKKPEDAPAEDAETSAANGEEAVPAEDSVEETDMSEFTD